MKRSGQRITGHLRVMGNAACSCVEATPHTHHSPHSSPCPSVELSSHLACHLDPSQEAAEDVALSAAERAHKLVEATFARESWPDLGGEDAASIAYVGGSAVTGVVNSHCPDEGALHPYLRIPECSPEQNTTGELDRTLLDLKDDIQRLAQIHDEIVIAETHARGTNGPCESEGAADAGPMCETACHSAPHHSHPSSRQFTAHDMELGLSPWVLMEGGQYCGGADRSLTAALDYISRLDDLECTQRKPAPKVQQARAEGHAVHDMVGQPTSPSAAHKQNVKITWIPRALQEPYNRSGFLRDARIRHEASGSVQQDKTNGDLPACELEKDTCFAVEEKLVDDAMRIKHFVTSHPPSYLTLPQPTLSFAAPPFIQSAGPEPTHTGDLAACCSNLQACSRSIGPSAFEPMSSWTSLSKPHFEMNVDDHLIRVRIFPLYYRCASIMPKLLQHRCSPRTLKLFDLTRWYSLILQAIDIHLAHDLFVSLPSSQPSRGPPTA